MDKDKVKLWLAIGTIGVGVLCVIGLFFLDIPDKNKDMINFALGSIMGWGGNVVSSYFGNTDIKEKKQDE